jgi:hypothetical protein
MRAITVSRFEYTGTANVGTVVTWIVSGGGFRGRAARLAARFARVSSLFA